MIIKDNVLTEFGFNSIEHFRNSLIRPNLFNVSIPVAIFGGMIENLFGVKAVFLIAFVALLTLELTSGIFASWIEGQKITSKRMKSFLMMLFVWLVVLFILNTFKCSFSEDNSMYLTFEYLFNAVILFVNVIYFKSIWENAGRIMDKKDEFKKLINIFNTKKLKNEDN